MKYFRNWYCYYEDNEWRAHVTDDAILQVKRVWHKAKNGHPYWSWTDYSVRLLYPKAWFFNKLWIADGVETLEDAISKATAYWNASLHVKKAKRKRVSR